MHVATDADSLLSEKREERRKLVHNLLRTWREADQPCESFWNTFPVLKWVQGSDNFDPRLFENSQASLSMDQAKVKIKEGMRTYQKLNARIRELMLRGAASDQETPQPRDRSTGSTRSRADGQNAYA